MMDQDEEYDHATLRAGPQGPLALDSSLQFIGDNLSATLSVKDRVLQAGRKNEKLSDVPDYAPELLSYEDKLDEHLELKLLHVAAWTGDLPTIRYLKAYGDGTERTAGGFTPLHLAASRGHTEALRLLLEWPNVDVEARSSEGFTALHLAAYGGHLDCVQLLLKKCSTDDHVNAKDHVMERTALHWAVCHTSGGESFDLLLQTPGIQTCPKDRVGFTPLHFATMNGEFTNLKGIVSELLSRHSDTLNDKVDDVRRFLKQPDVKKFDTERWRQLSGIKMVRPGDATRLPDPSLHESGFMSGYTALHFAACQNNVEVVSHLLTYPGIEVNVPGFEHGLTPLHCSLLYGARKVFELLMSFEKVDVNAQSKQGGDANHHWKKPRPEVYDALRPFRSLETPLHFGIRFCAPQDFLQMMIRFCNHPKVKVATCNDEGVLPLQLAWGRSYLADTEDTDLDIDLDPDTQLQHALDILEGQSGNELLMSKLSDQTKAFENIMNAVLVSATLIASVTFSAIVQSPFRSDATNDSKVEKVIVRFFAATISVSFYTAVNTIVCCLVSLYVQPAQKSHRRRVHHDIRGNIQDFNIFMLLFSVYSGACAFVVSGYMNIPSYAILYMTLGWLFFCLIIPLPFQAAYGYVSSLELLMDFSGAGARIIGSLGDEVVTSSLENFLETLRRFVIFKAVQDLKGRNKRKYSGVYGYSLRLVGDTPLKPWCIGTIIVIFYMSFFLVFLPVLIPFLQSFKEFFVFIYSKK